MACWGHNYSGQATPPAGAFQQVAAGLYFSCALKADNTLVCWGDNASGQATPPAGAFQQVVASAGGDTGCALKADGTLACWGDNLYGQATPPAGTFKQVAAGPYHTSGIRADGFVAGWGVQAR